MALPLTVDTRPGLCLKTSVSFRALKANGLKGATTFHQDTSVGWLGPRRWRRRQLVVCTQCLHLACYVKPIYEGHLAQLNGQDVGELTGGPGILTLSEVT